MYLYRSDHPDWPGSEGTPVGGEFQLYDPAVAEVYLERGYATLERPEYALADGGLVAIPSGDPSTAFTTAEVLPDGGDNTHPLVANSPAPAADPETAPEPAPAA